MKGFTNWLTGQREQQSASSNVPEQSGDTPSFSKGSPQSFGPTPPQGLLGPLGMSPDVTVLPMSPPPMSPPVEECGNDTHPIDLPAVPKMPSPIPLEACLPGKGPAVGSSCSGKGGGKPMQFPNPFWSQNVQGGCGVPYPAQDQGAYGCSGPCGGLQPGGWGGPCGGVQPGQVQGACGGVQCGQVQGVCGGGHNGPCGGCVYPPMMGMQGKETSQLLSMMGGLIQNQQLQFQQLQEQQKVMVGLMAQLVSGGCGTGGGTSSGGSGVEGGIPPATSAPAGTMSSSAFKRLDEKLILIPQMPVCHPEK